MKSYIINLVMLILMISMLVGCQNSKSNVLIGNWKYTEKIDTSNANFEIQFFEDNYFQYYKCLNSNDDNLCDNGYILWSGKYELKDNVVYLTIENENQLIKFSNEYIGNPDNKFIINFKNMYLCSEIDDVDCKQKYKKTDDKIVKKDITKENIEIDDTNDKIKSFSNKILEDLISKAKELHQNYESINFDMKKLNYDENYNKYNIEYISKDGTRLSLSFKLTNSELSFETIEIRGVYSNLSKINGDITETYIITKNLLKNLNIFNLSVNDRAIYDECLNGSEIKFCVTKDSKYNIIVKQTDEISFGADFSIMFSNFYI